MDKNKFRNRLILMVDDEKRMRTFVRMNLEVEGFRVVEAGNGQEAIDKVRTELPDLVVMDVAMPVMDGFEALEQLRKFSNVPVILLTVKSEEIDRILGLDLGADDYITKPFSPRELASRIRAVLRRVELSRTISENRAVKVDDYLQIDFPRHEVIVDGKRIKLRPTEHRLLYHLVQNAGWILSHEQILSRVWGPEYRDESHLLRLYINYLRKKIEPNLEHPRYILTERGVGYQFVSFKHDNQDANTERQEN